MKVPIEKQYRKKGKKKEDIDIQDFRNECREFARNWIEIQKNSFIRLFIFRLSIVRLSIVRLPNVTDLLD